jgi:hypothetical protein
VVPHACRVQRPCPVAGPVRAPALRPLVVLARRVPALWRLLARLVVLARRVPALWRVPARLVVRVLALARMPPTVLPPPVTASSVLPS